jgi:nitroreductase
MSGQSTGRTLQSHIATELPIMEPKMIKHAKPDFPIHELIAQRWSPYAFSEKPVADELLRSLFEAARWAASSYNEQPWRFIVATKDQPEEYARALSCLVEPNQEWARHAPVLVLAACTRKFTHNGQPNRVAEHDLGLATGNLMLEATARGLSVHAMAGILPDRVRELYSVPADVDVHTAFAIGYAAAGNEKVDPKMRERDQSPRSRKPLGEIVFTGGWGKAARVVGR